MHGRSKTSTYAYRKIKQPEVNLIFDWVKSFQKCGSQIHSMEPRTTCFGEIATMMVMMALPLEMMMDGEYYIIIHIQIFYCT